MKTCRDCGEEKSSTEFIKNKTCSDGIDTLCLACNRLRVKQWRNLNPEKRKEQAKKESDPTKLYNRRKHLKAAYGITPEEYDLIYISQDGYCAICGVHQSNIDRKFHLDHCHTTGKIRGLLCPHCNHLLGYARDNPNTLAKAARYLHERQDIDND